MNHRLLSDFRTDHGAALDALFTQVDSPEYQAFSARRRAARKRAAAERLERLEQAVAQLPELKRKQAEAARQAGHGKRGEQIRQRQQRVSTTDAEARVMKMPNGLGGHPNPAIEGQLKTGLYEKVINVKADVAAVLVPATQLPGVVLNTVKGVPQDVHLDP